MATSTPTLGDVADKLLLDLSHYLPHHIAGLPDPTVIMTNLRERSAGLGRHVGTDKLGDFDVVTLKGIRLEGVARFQLWAALPGDIDAAIAVLNAAILTARDALRVQGFLKVTMKDSKPAEHLDTVGWRRSADYRILYEFPYSDSDDSASLLARIPIGIDSVFHEKTVVSDHMARWDNEAAPGLVSRGPLGITALSALGFIPGASPTGGVTLLRTFDDATGAPTPHATIASFLQAVAGPVPAERHASITFASLHDFLTALSAQTGVITLGDWDVDHIPDPYEPRSLTIDPAIRLPGVADRFEITYGAASFDHVAVLYLRLGRSLAP